MEQVISALERQIRIEEMKIVSNRMERESAGSLPGYKGQALHTENPEYLDELRKAVAVLKTGETPSPTSPKEEKEDGRSEMDKDWERVCNRLYDVVGRDYLSLEEAVVSRLKQVTELALKYVPAGNEAEQKFLKYFLKNCETSDFQPGGRNEGGVEGEMRSIGYYALLPKDEKLRMLKEAKGTTWYDGWKPYCVMCGYSDRMSEREYGFQCPGCNNIIGWDLKRCLESPLNTVKIKSLPEGETEELKKTMDESISNLSEEDKKRVADYFVPSDSNMKSDI